MDRITRILTILFTALALAITVYPQSRDTAYIPFSVNVGAKVVASRDGRVFQRDAQANRLCTLAVYMGGTQSVTSNVARVNVTN